MTTTLSNFRHISVPMMSSLKSLKRHMNFEKLLPHMEDSDDVIDEPSSLPAILTTQTSDQDIAYAVWKTRSTMFATPVGMAWRGRCSGELELEFIDTTDAYHHITGTEMAMGGHTFMCESKDGGLDVFGADRVLGRGLGGFSPRFPAQVRSREL